MKNGQIAAGNKLLPLADGRSVTARRFRASEFRDSVRIAVAAARAAATFQPSTSRSGVEVALPFLEDYFGLLARATPVPLDIKATARAELDWWQSRREAIPPRIYGAMIARVSTLLYGSIVKSSARP